MQKVMEESPIKESLMLAYMSSITGCVAAILLTLFFCFPCLLFGGESAWTVTGQRDLENMNAKIKKHASSTQHLNRVIDLSLLGTSNIANAIDSGHALYIARHNAEVQKNRDTLSKIIDCIKLCGKCELPLRGHDETPN